MVFAWIKEKVASSVGTLSKALKGARDALMVPMKRLLGQEALSEEALEELEELLYEADFGSHLTHELIEAVNFAKVPSGHDPLQVRLQAIREKLIAECQCPANTSLEKIYQGSCSLNSPFILFVVGINGSGKTTSIAKLIRYYQSQHKKVLVAAADTFRAAASEQLHHWAEHLSCDIVMNKETKDPSAVVFDACERAKSGDYDILLIDTAGRWHNKEPLMQELAKMQRICEKQMGRSADACLLTIDAVIGQNALEQAKAFGQICDLGAMILTKIDGAAKGGAALSIMHQMKLPIAFLGTGERKEDLQRFDLKEFVDELIHY